MMMHGMVCQCQSNELMGAGTCIHANVLSGSSGAGIMLATQRYLQGTTTVRHFYHAKLCRQAALEPGSSKMGAC